MMKKDIIKGTLIDGIEWPRGSGMIQKDFEMRSPKVRDTVKLYDDTELIKRYGTNSIYMEIAIIAVCMEKLGDVPKENFSPGLLMELSDRDGAVLTAAFRGYLPKNVGADAQDQGAPREGDETEG